MGFARGEILSPAGAWDGGEKSSEEFAQEGALVKPFLVPDGDGELRGLEK